MFDEESVGLGAAAGAVAQMPNGLCSFLCTATLLRLLVFCKTSILYFPVFCTVHCRPQVISILSQAQNTGHSASHKILSCTFCGSNYSLVGQIRLSVHLVYFALGTGCSVQCCALQERD